ncbi:MAG: phosphoribosyltransferase family protein [Candidatus Paceibacterota bacterium]
MLINFINLFKSFSKSFFPRKCVGCKTPDFWICKKCLKNIPISEEKPEKWIYSVFSYRSNVLRKVIWDLKFRGKYSVLEDMEEKIRKEFIIFLSKNNLNKETLYLVPIPITKESQKRRKYNQSFLIAKKIVKENENIKNILVKTKNHKSQNKIKNRNERLRNVVGSFSVKENNIPKNSTIVLIDDIVTTGATLSEAKRSLKEYGFKNIFAFTLGH